MLKRKGLVLLMVLVLVLTVTVSAGALDKIRVGVMYALSGEGADIGITQRHGAQLAVEEYNENGGVEINGEKVPVEMVVRDTETKPDVAVRRYRELTADGVRVFVGGTFGHIATALNSQAMAGTEFVMVTNGIEERIFEKANKAPYYYSSLGATDPIGRIIAAHVAQKHDPDHVMLVLPDYSYGHGAHTGAMQVFNEEYPDIKVETIWTPVGTPDFTSYLQTVIEKEPDVAMFGQWGTDGTEIITQAGEMGLLDVTIPYFNSLNAAMALGVPSESLVGWNLGLWAYHNLDFLEDESPETVEAVNSLSERWLEAFDEKPDIMAIYAYIGMKETLRAIDEADSVNPAEMSAALQENPEFLSAKGPATWREDGRPFYEFAKFIGKGLAEEDRPDKWTYAEVVDYYQGPYLAKPLEEMGY